MSAQALVRIAGHRLRLIPFTPYRLTRLAPGEDTPADSIHMVRVQEGEVRQFELRPGAPNAPAAELTRRQDAPEGWVAYRMGPRGAEVRLRAGLAPRLDADGSVTAGPDTDHWTVETTLFRCAWPEGLTLASTEPGAPSPFEFYGPEGAVLFFQGPIARESLPKLEALAGPGQKVLGTTTTAGAPAVDIAYELDGAEWRQRHVALSLTEAHALVLTAQALDRHMPRMLAHAEAVVASFQPGPPGQD